MIGRLRRRLARLNKQLEDLESRHKGCEHDYTYWGGWSMGYLKGKIAVLEEIIDDLEFDDGKH